MTLTAARLPGDPLHPSDLDRLAQCGISAQTANAALLRRVDSLTGAELMGRNGSADYSGIVVPYIWPGEDWVREHRLRRDHPEIENGKPKNKYLSPPGTGNMLYFQPATDPAWLSDIEIPILLVEGEKKCLALAELAWYGIGEGGDQPRWLSIAISGVKNWRGKIGKVEGPNRGERLDEVGPIPDLSRLTWTDRQVTILFDLNVHTNEDVRIARLSLAKELRSRGARVLFVDIPADLEASVNGVDDLIGLWGRDRVLELIANGSYDPKKKTQGDEDGNTARSGWPDELQPEAFYGIAGDLVRLIEPHSESDPAALLLQLLVSFGNLIGRQAHFMAEADRHFTNLFVVIVGQTAKGRKGTSLGQIQRILRLVDKVWSETSLMGGLASGEGLIWAVRDKLRERVPIHEKGHILRYEEQVSDNGEQDKRLLLVETEFARVLSVAEREANTLSAIIRQAWDTGNLRILTKNQPAQSTEAHISIIGHITKDELKRLLTDTAAANGFANRFLWTCARRSKVLAEGGTLHTVDLAPIARQLATAAEFARSVGSMRRDDTAREIWREVYPQLSEGKPGLFGSVTSRAEAQTMRLSCLYALLDKSDEVRSEHLKAGLAVWQYCENSARFIFGDTLGDATADEILRELRGHSNGVTRNEIREHFNRNKSAAEIGRALGVLQEYGLAHMVRGRETEGQSRPTERWHAVNAVTRVNASSNSVNSVNRVGADLSA